ncbi:MAG: hypothetical protein GX587_08105 [Bacteroidales bacterium]|nr:hypothetical protein [Bacteroidales bacterium]
MRFIDPLFLWASLAAIIPVIVHLFNFRRFKKLYFSNVRFLEQLQLQTQKQSRLRHLLVLMMRILGILFLVMAFARPYIPGKDDFFSADSRIISIYVDNSYSMGSLGREGDMFKEAKKRAVEIVNAYRVTDKFNLVTNDFEGLHQRLVSRESFLEMLEDVELSPSRKSMSEIIDRQKYIISENHLQSAHLYLLSDYQKNICDFESIENDSLLKMFFVPFESSQADNLFIDSAWFESPVLQIGRPVVLNVRVGASGNGSYKGESVRLFVNGVQKSIAGFELEGGQMVEVQMGYTIHETGNHNACLELTDYPVNFDDKLFFNYHLSTSIPLLTVNGTGISGALNTLFGNDSSFVFGAMDEGQLDYTSFSKNNAIFLNQLGQIGSGMVSELVKYVEDGGTLVFLPSDNPKTEDYQMFFNGFNLGVFPSADTTDLYVSDLLEMHPLFEGIFEFIPENMDMPFVKKYYPYSFPQKGTAVPLLSLQNGRPFFTAFDFGKGKLYVSAVGLNDNFSNFHRHALFVPLFYNIALSSGTHPPMYYQTNTELPVRIQDIELRSDRVATLKGEGIEVIPEQRNINNVLHLFPHGQIQKAGRYEVSYQDSVLSYVSFNYPRLESMLECYDAKTFNDLLTANNIQHNGVLELEKQSFEKYIERFGQGIPLFRWFILLALICFAAEVLLLRYFRK